jgi:Spy/CpxP family protein refolding chaperone
MKKTVAALALGAILIPAAVIAGGHYGEHRGEHHAERMTEQLQLTEQQQTEMKKIYAEQREQRRALRKQTQKRFHDMLTPEQQAKWQRLRDERRQRFCDRDGKHGMGHHRDGEGFRQGPRDDS